MGMYTEIMFRAEVSAESAHIISLASECGYDDGFEGAWPDHPFFETPRFPAVFIGNSAYFPGVGHLTIIAATDDDFAKYGPRANEWAIVDFRSSLKNYDGEIGLFFDWIRPHVRPSGGGGSRSMLGYSLYEDSDEPIIYYQGALK